VTAEKINRKEAKTLRKEQRNFLACFTILAVLKRLEEIMANDIEAVARDIVDAAFKVHKEFGPGLLESAYKQCHAYELRKRGRKVLTEVVLQSFMMDKRLIQAIESIWLLTISHRETKRRNPSSIHTAQLITYLKLKDCRLVF